MSLTPYQQQRSIFAANCEVADRQAVVLAEAHSKDYAVARKEYQLGHVRYSTRTPRAAPPDPSTVATRDTFIEDLSNYTSSPEPNTDAYYNEDGTVSTRAVDKELKERAKVRQKECMDRARRMREAMLLSGNTKSKEEPLEQLLTRFEEQAYEDIVTLEAHQFRTLAKAYYDTFYGKYDSVLSTERESRRTMEDVQLAVALGELAVLRDRIHHAEELLMLRAMGMYPLQLLRNNQARALEAARAAEKAAEDANMLDSMYAVPLWQRVLAIRAETAAEEEATFRTLGLAHATEADLIVRGLGRQNMAKGGVFEVRRPGAVPAYLEESLRYAFAAEKLFCELGEETGRMTIIDEAVQGFEELFSAMHQPIEATEIDGVAEPVAAIM